MSKKRALSGLLLLILLMLLSCGDLFQFIEEDTRTRFPTIVLKLNDVERPKNSTVDIGSYQILESLSVEFTIQNDGEADLVLSEKDPVLVGGTNPSDFNISSYPDTRILPETTSSFDLVFTPQAVGSRSCTLSISCNDPRATTYTINVVATGDPTPKPEIQVKQGSTVLDDLVTDPLYGFNFGSVVADGSGGIAGSDLTFDISNIGTADLSVSSVAFVPGYDEGEFVLNNTTVVSPVAPSGSTSFNIRFDPDNLGEQTAYITIANSDEDEGTYTFKIKGTGILAGTAAAPTFSPAQGAYNTSQNVSISTATAGATIRYTIGDGSQAAPTSTSGTVYSTPVSVSETNVLKAIAYKSGWADSSVAEAFFVILPLSEVIASGNTATFTMGDIASGYSDEKPQHSVTLTNAYSISTFEITNLQFCKVMNWAIDQGYAQISGDLKDASGSVTYAAISSMGTHQFGLSASGGYLAAKSNREDHPVVGATWHGALAFCNYLSELAGEEIVYNLSSWSCDWSKSGYRLATEAEWEYAAKQTNANVYPWGGTMYSNAANFWTSGDPFDDETDPYTANGGPTTPVGYYDGSVQGSYTTNDNSSWCDPFDMSGNVAEWVWDWYQADYYTSDPVTDPTGPASGLVRGARGGAWSSWDSDIYQGADVMRCIRRGSRSPTVAPNDVGLRIILVD